MPDGSPSLTLTLHPGIAEIGAAEWDECAGADNPFVSYALLGALEDSGLVVELATNVDVRSSALKRCCQI